ncbi:hypothetical protein G7046_g1663 [Stylonectria norvegica]|nr:hypothetical protein G7046_g1663 [Stylonectria norvegica]
MKTIGLLGGMSYHSTILYYRHINVHIQRRLGPPNAASLILHSFNFASIAPLFTSNAWPSLASTFIAAGTALKRSGADGLAIGCNIGHRVAPELATGTGLPVLHIADAVARVVAKGGVRRVGLLATKAVMEDSFIKGPLVKGAGIKEVFGAGPERSRWMNGLVEKLISRGAEGIVLACTDLQSLIEPEKTSVPVFDTLELHATYIAEWSMDDQ